MRTTENNSKNNRKSSGNCQNDTEEYKTHKNIEKSKNSNKHRSNKNKKNHKNSNTFEDEKLNNK